MLAFIALFEEDITRNGIDEQNNDKALLAQVKLQLLSKDHLSFKNISILI